MSRKLALAGSSFFGIFALGALLAFGSVALTPQSVEAQSCAMCQSDETCTAVNIGWCSCSFENGNCQAEGFCPGCIEEVGLIPDDQLREFRVNGQRAVLARIDADRYAAWGCDRQVRLLMVRGADGTWKQVDPATRRADLPSWEEYSRRFKEVSS